MTEKLLTLFCVVDGGATPFSVEIEPSKTIGSLKKAIKAKKANDFSDVDAEKLTLWRVSIPVLPKKDSKDIWLADVLSKVDLNETDDIADVFAEAPPKKTIHIVVQRPPPVNALLEKIRNETFQADSAISRFLRSFVEGDIAIPTVDCCVKGLPRTWLRSKYFATESNQPALYLLHPRRPLETTTTPPSMAALHTIKKFRNNDMITFFGVSGCGKTRAVVEMLGQNWGFYLNGSAADRGSNDITTLFKSAQGKAARYFSSDKTQNGHNVQAITACLLIARLMVLQYCLSLGRHDTFTCERWMLLQVLPGTFDDEIPDVFDAVFRNILDAYHGQSPINTPDSLNSSLQHRFRHVQDLISSSSSDPPTKTFLVVLDEAQTLSDHGRQHFVSSMDSRDPRSVLSPIIHGLRKISVSEKEYCLVTCGTGIGADEHDILLDSCGIEATTLDPFEPQIVDFSGWETEDQVAMYIKNLGEAMDEDDRMMLHRLIPKAAVQELFFKLRGRYRPIITTIEDIIANGTPSYWREAIERRVEALVCYPKQFPMRGNHCSDIKRMLDKVAKDPIMYANVVELKHVIKQAVLLRASLGLPWRLRREEPILVESSCARLRIVDNKDRLWKSIDTIIDEPFVFQAFYNFIKNEDKGFYKRFREQYGDLEDPQSEEMIFERRAPMDLIYAFHNKQLKQELFSILEKHITQLEPVTFPKHLFTHQATIVGWEGHEWEARHNSALTMHDFMEAHCRNSSRKDDYEIPPFYYLESSQSGPDIVFVLPIDDLLYPVFVQTKLDKDKYPRDVDDARLTVHDSRIRDHLPNLAEYFPGGKYLSLLYIHSTINRTLRKGWDSDRLWDSKPESGAKNRRGSTEVDGPVMQLLMIIDESNRGNFVPSGVDELLNSVKGTKRVNGQSDFSYRA
ncbi:hypothetical protein BG004_001163 [Podila humilis]|nr:hypothetical protein BG004_001163 [Podila humilis]